MEFQKLNAPSLKELFISELENMIISGRLPIGTKLPSERELASSMFHVPSSTPVSPNLKRRGLSW